MSIEVYDNFLPTEVFNPIKEYIFGGVMPCLLYTSPSPRDVEESRMPSSA